MKNKTLLEFFKTENLPKDFKINHLINGKSEKYVLGIINYEKATFFYFLFVNHNKEKRIIVLNPRSPMRYTKKLDSINFKRSFLWIRKKYCFITNDFS